MDPSTSPEPVDPVDPAEDPASSHPLPAKIDDERRSRLNDALTLAVGRGSLDLSEFSELSTAVWSITAPEQFSKLERAVAERTTTRIVGEPAASTGPTLPAPGQFLVFGDFTLAGDRRLANRESYRLLFGDLALDLREASLTAAETIIDISMLFGDLRVTVPPGIRIDNRASLTFGSARIDQGPRTSPGAPVIILVGRAVFGDLRITVAEPGADLRSRWEKWLSR